MDNIRKCDNYKYNVVSSETVQSMLNSENAV
jgi:hypothetical protein